MMIVMDGRKVRFLREIGLWILIAALGCGGMGRAIAEYGLDEELDPRLRVVGEFGILLERTRLYASIDDEFGSGSFIDEMTIVRLDAEGNGFARLHGSEWFVRSECVDKININILIPPLYAITIKSMPLKTGASEDAPESPTHVPLYKLVRIEGETEGCWLIQADGVYGFINKNTVLILPERIMNRQTMERLGGED